MALALTSPSVAISARLEKMEYMPTALKALQLPSGLGDLQSVPRLQDEEEQPDEALRLAEYVRAIRATARVFATYQHKIETLAAYDAYMVWIDAWARLSSRLSGLIV